MYNSFRIILGLLYVMLIVALVVMAIITYHNRGESDSRADAVKHTLQVIELAHEISSLYGELQLLSNAHAAGVDDRLPEIYAQVKRSLDERLMKIRMSTLDNPEQAIRFDSLERNLKALVSSTDSGIAIKPIPAPDAGISARMARDTDLRMELHEVMKSIRNAEQQILLTRERDYAESLDRYHNAFNMLLAGVIVTLGASFLIVRHNFNRRLQIEAERQRDTDLFFELFNENPVAGLVCRSSDLTVLNCNQRYIQMFNRSRNEIVGSRPLFLDLVPESQRQRLEASARRQEKLHDMEIKLDAFRKDTVWLEISLQPVTVQNEPCTRFTIQDITAHKKAELDTKAALAAEVALNKMKSDFITLASHEFRTPLTSINTSAALLKTIPTSETERLEKHASRIKTSVDTISSILDDFLSVNRIDEGALEVKRTRFDITESVRALCDGLRPFTKAGQRIVYTHVGGKFVQLDKTLFDAIVNNLIRNAIKYSPEDSVIEVNSHTNQNCWLTVKDSGIGISADEQPRLFERFFRASNAANIQGTGLGLYIVKRYVEKLHGTVEVNSKPGAGSEFRVTFKDAVW